MSILLSAAALAEPERLGRRLPDGCAVFVESEEAGDETAEARWNRHYLAGVRAIEAKELRFAERSFCLALGAARAFDERDWRFAETLDELGLVAFLDADHGRSEAMQGAAVAEMLLAVGPQETVLSTPPGRASCRSSVATYLERLGWIYDALHRAEEFEDLRRQPHRIFRRGYLALDRRLAGRLDWLISRYLLAEEFAAAQELRDLQDELQGPPA